MNVIFFKQQKTHFRSQDLTERVGTVEADLKQTIDQLNSTKDELSQYKSENRGLHEEMKVINEVGRLCAEEKHFFNPLFPSSSVNC